MIFPKGKLLKKNLERGNGGITIYAVTLMVRAINRHLVFLRWDRTILPMFIYSL